jgi:hypothetical protein
VTLIHCYLSENSEYIIDTNAFHFGDVKEGEFYNIENMVTRITAIDETADKFIHLRIELDQKFDDYEIQVTNFLDFTGNLGGVFEISEIL